MSEILTDAFKALGSWPIVQGAAALLVLYVGLSAIRRGERDRKPSGSNGNGQPNWSLYGPVHDAMGAVHEMNEQSRRHVDLLSRCEEHLRQIAETTRGNTAILEMIRNESRLR